MIEKYYKNISAPVGTPGIRAPSNPHLFSPPAPLASPLAISPRWDDLARSRTLGRGELYGGVRCDVYILETMICENDMYPTNATQPEAADNRFSTYRTSSYNRIEIKSVNVLIVI